MMRIIIHQPELDPKSPEAVRPWMAHADNHVYGWGNTPQEALDALLKRMAE